MDCCSTNTKKETKENMKGGKKMEINKKTMLWIVVGILLIAVLFMTFKVSSIDTSTAQATAPAVKAAASAGSGMVGGC